MADITSVDLARLAGDNLEQASLGLPRAMVKTFTEALMGAEADAVCGAPYGQPSEDRVNYRNGYRDRRWETRRARSIWQCPGCGPALTSRTGCWSGAAAASRR